METILIEQIIRTLILSILLTSCTHYQPKSFIVGYKCPGNYYYRLNDNLCYPLTVNKPIKPIIKPEPRVTKGKSQIKAVMSCNKVYEAMNRCMGGK